MSPEHLDFGVKHEASQIERRLRRALDDIVDTIGLGIAAAACDIDRPDLRKALDGKDGRHLRLGWLIPLLRFASTEDRLRVLNELLAPFGLTAVPRSRRSPERRLLDLEQRIREELGTAGARVVEDERSKP